MTISAQAGSALTVEHTARVDALFADLNQPDAPGASVMWIYCCSMAGKLRVSDRL